MERNAAANLVVQRVPRRSRAETTGRVLMRHSSERVRLSDILRGTRP